MLGLEIKQRSPFPVPFTASLTNGYCGYVPTEEAFEQWVQSLREEAFIRYRVRPGE